MDTTEKKDIPINDNDTVNTAEDAAVAEESKREVSDSSQPKKETKEKKPKKIKVCESELAELQAKAKKLDELQDTFVRRVADFENAKKRLVREKEEFAKFASERIIAAFLPVLDNLDRALHHGGNTDTVDGVLSGVQLIKKQINDILEANGLEKIETLGKQFDPHVHEAMGTVESTDHPDDAVFEEIQAGYMLKDKLLRPSWVRVAKNPNDDSSADAASVEGTSDAVSSDASEASEADNEEQEKEL